MFQDLMIGGFAGVISRTLTAPLELFKIQRQNGFVPGSTLKYVFKKEGIRYLWKGNATNCVRIFPQFAINYAVFRFTKENIWKNYFKTENMINFFAGACGGMTAMGCIYPLEAIRSRLSLQTHKSKYTGIVDAFRKMSFRELYQGLSMSLAGFTPYNAINFSCYFIMKEKLNDLGIESNIVKISAGGLSSMIAVSFTYPTDLVRRRMQLQGFDPSVPKYDGVIDCIKKIGKTEGYRGFYRGLGACYIKLLPSAGLQFWAMEHLKTLFSQI